MAKMTALVAGGIADVSTEFRVAPASAYTIKIESIEAKKSRSQKPMLVMTTTIQDEVGPDGSNVKGVMMFENFVLENDKGEPNQPALRQFKRMVEAIYGKDAADDPDFDYDVLVGWVGTAQVEIDTYEKDGQDVQKNYVKKFVG